MDVLSCFEQKCYVGSTTAEECQGIAGYKLLEDGWYCYDGVKSLECPPKKVNEIPSSDGGGTEIPNNESSEKDINGGGTEIPNIDSSQKDAESGTTKNGLSKTFGITTILILLSFIL